MKIFLQPILLLLFPLLSFSQNKESFSVYFELDSDRLTPAAAAAIDSFFTINKSGAALAHIELNGHCDIAGSNEYNDRLSERRIRTVATYIRYKEYTLHKNIFVEKGYGKRTPVNANRTEEERQLNRRVEIILMKTAVIPDEPQEDLVVVKEKTGTLKQKISDSSTVVGTNIVLRNINFVGGMHLFLQESEPMLKELLDAMRTYSQLIIRVEGHICCIPDAKDGPDNGTGLNNLSEARAKAVQDYLLKNGIASNRVTYKGFGHSTPIYPYPEQTEEERIANRRVEIKIISK